jgi:DNA (cytosine-5)-methyltransferase 3A
MASEIEKNAIKVSEKNYPDIIRVGDVVRLEVEGQVDLLIGGSPCTDLSIAKKDRKGLEGDKSCLFWEFVRIKKECNPQWFVLENVASMPKADRDIITREIGVEPVMFNASLVSAQCRKRLFWTNIPFDLPADRGILIKDILEADVDEKFYVKKPMTATLASVGHLVKVGHVEPNVQGNRVYSTEGKATALSAEGGGLAGGTTLVKQEERIRKLTPIECERLQGLPDNYTEGVATTHRYRCLGNAFNCDVVAHILSRVKLMYSRVVNP